MLLRAGVKKEASGDIRTIVRPLAIGSLPEASRPDQAATERALMERFLRSALQFARNPLSTKRHRAVAFVACVIIGIVLPSDRISAAAALTAVLVTFLQLAATNRQNRVSAKEEEQRGPVQGDQK